MVIWVTRGIAAGSVLATIELRVLLLEFADACVSSSIYSRLTLYVDDAMVETICAAKRICREHAKATNTFTNALRGIRMLFSDTKNVICASTEKVAGSIRGKLHGITVRVAGRAVSLGSGIGGGTRRNVRQLNKRLKAFRARVPRFKALRRCGVRTDRLLRTGGTEGGCSYDLRQAMWCRP